ncbi:hypothetical protein B0H14DRAFT_2844671, partial [Mycena olivaceomarginata]
ACRTLCRATRAKILWVYVLERQKHKEGKFLPYMKRYDLLDSAALEALACRVSRLDMKWKTGVLSPTCDWGLHLPQSITWLRLVAGAWLFVASSDNHVSKISCWALASVFQGFKEPLAEAYLPGQVKTGKLEVQESGVVLALGLGPESPAVHILTLRKHAAGHAFSELHRIEGSSHVLMLCENLLGCALRDGAIVLHLVNWKENRIHDIPGLDVSGHRSVPHLMTIRKKFLVILRRNALQVYILSSVLDGPYLLVQQVEIPTVWEAAVISKASPDTSLSLIVLSPAGLEMCVVNLSMLPVLDDQPVFVRFSLCKKTPNSATSEPWYRLCVGETGRRSLWISATDIAGPQFIYTNVPPHPSHNEEPAISWTHDGSPDQPALWALPVLDIDEALGLTVIGNCFGELAIYDHVGGHPEKCTGLALDFTDQQTSSSSLMPTLPIPLNLSVVPPCFDTPTEPDPSMVPGWSQDDIDLGDVWRKDWVSEYSRGYVTWDEWQGVPFDFAWILEHAYGFPGKIIPQAYMDEDLHCFQHVLFRLGNRYLVFTGNAPMDEQLKSWPVYPATRNRLFKLILAQPEVCTRRTAITERIVYKISYNEEMWGEETEKKNRLVEQAERGGRPHENLFVMAR